MNCIKCGRETRGEQVFCLDCQEVMKKYPVKPNTYVKLPEHREPPRRSVKRRTVTTDDQIRVLKHKVRDLTVGLLLCLVIMAGLLYFITNHLSKDHYKPGQNYSVITAPPNTEETTPAR